MSKLGSSHFYRYLLVLLSTPGTTGCMAFDVRLIIDATSHSSIRRNSMQFALRGIYTWPLGPLASLSIGLSKDREAVLKAESDNETAQGAG
jgi:hypothetical protein